MAAAIPDSIIDEVNRKTDIADVVSAYVHLTSKGGKLWGLCPFHTEKTPSFSVTRDSNLYYCFGCQRGGGVFRFLMDIEGLTFPEAVQRLAEKAGVEIPQTSGSLGERDKRKALEELYNRVSRTFRWLLLNHKDADHARKYLQLRGISDQTAEDFQLGWAPGEAKWLHDFLLKKNYKPRFLQESGLFSKKYPDWSLFVDRLMFPIMPESKRVVAFSGRSLNDHGPKYINSPETVIYRKKSQMYGFSQARNSIRKSANVYITEGNFDVLACHQAGYTQTVAPLGTAFTEEQARVLKRYCNEMILVFDGDEAGERATMKASITGEQSGFSVKAAIIPQGSDPAELLARKGSETLKKILSEPIIIFDYLLNCLLGSQSVSSGDAQEEALNELTPYLFSVESDIRRQAYLRQFAETVKADPQAVFKGFARLSSNSGRSKKISKTIAVSSSDLHFADQSSAELLLMTAIAINTEYFPVLRKELAPEMLRDRRALTVYRIMDELNVQGRIIRTDVIIDELEDRKISDYILKSASSGKFDENAEVIIKDIIRLIRVTALSDERTELKNKLASSEDESEIPERTRSRLARIMEIDREIEEMQAR